MGEMQEQAVDLSVARALFAARLLEDALHHPGPWTIRWADIEVEAERTVTPEGVVFAAVFPAVCYIEQPTGSMELRCEGQVRGLRSADQINHPGDTAFLVTWALLARDRLESVKP
jgi:hypothetical protein